MASFAAEGSVLRSAATTSGRHTPISRMIVSSDRALANKALKAVLAVHPLMAAEEGYTVGPGGLITHRSPLGLAIQFGDVEMVETILATGAVDPNVRGMHFCKAHLHTFTDPWALRAGHTSRSNSAVLGLLLLPTVSV